MNRYELIQKDIKYLLRDKEDESTKFEIDCSQNPIFVDILEIPNKYWAKIRLNYSDGKIVVGWTWLLYEQNPLRITNMDELFDGRFNSTEIC